MDTPDATLVCHRNRVQEVKDLVADLHRRQMTESCSTLRWNAPGVTTP